MSTSSKLRALPSLNQLEYDRLLEVFDPLIKEKLARVTLKGQFRLFQSLLATQTAFPDDVSLAVYANEQYYGIHDTLNTKDGAFYNSLGQNMVDISGNNSDGYVLNKEIVVKG